MKLPNDPSRTASPEAEPKRSALSRRLRGETISEPPAAQPSAERYSGLAQRLRVERSLAGSSDEPTRPYLEQPPSRSGVHALRVDEALTEKKKQGAG